MKRNEWMRAAALGLLALGCSSESRDPSGPGPAGSTATIGAEGGSLSATLEGGSSMTVSIPAGALLDSTEISLQPADRSSGDAAAFSLSPGGLRLYKPVVLEIHLSSGIEMDDALAIGFRQDGEEIPVPTTVSAANRTVTATLSTLGIPETIETPPASQSSIRAPVRALGSLQRRELVIRFRAAQRAVAQLQQLGTIDAADAAQLSVAAVLDLDPEAAMQIVEFPNVIIRDWRNFVCDQFRFTTNALTSFGFISDYPGLIRVVSDVVAWGEARDEMEVLLVSVGLARCGNGSPDPKVVVDTKITAIAPEISLDLTAFQLGTKAQYDSFVVKRIVPLLTLSAGLQAADYGTTAQRLLDVLEPQSVRMRDVAYQDCRARRSQEGQSILTILEGTSGEFLAMSPYNIGSLKSDVELCGMQITWQIRDSSGADIISQGEVGGGNNPGEVLPAGEASMRGSMVLHLTGNLNALICPAAASANNEQLVIEAAGSSGTFQQLGLLTPSNDNHYLAASPLTITPQQLRTAAGISGEGGTVHVRVRRIGGTCSGLFLDLEHHTLGEIELDLNQFEIVTDTLATAHKGLEYQFQLTASAAGVWAVDDDDELPAGLSLSSAGMISGTPTEAGEFGVRIKATSGGTTVIKQFTVKIDLPDLSGDWSGSFTVRLATGGSAGLPVTMHLIQDGSAVTGTWQADQIHNGIVFGFVDSWTLVSGTMSMGSPECGGGFSGEAQILPGVTGMTGTFEGADCHNTHEGGVVTLHR